MLDGTWQLALAVHQDMKMPVHRDTVELHQRGPRDGIQDFSVPRQPRDAPRAEKCDSADDGATWCSKRSSEKIEGWVTKILA